MELAPQQCVEAGQKHPSTEITVKVSRRTYALLEEMRNRIMGNTAPITQEKKSDGLTRKAIVDMIIQSAYKKVVVENMGLEGLLLK